MSEQTDNQPLWQTTPLSDDLEELCNLYVRSGLTLDQLPYTQEFEQLVRDAGLEPSRENLRKVFHKLLYLRKQGRLPRAYNRAT